MARATAKAAHRPKAGPYPVRSYSSPTPVDAIANPIDVRSRTRA